MLGSASHAANNTTPDGDSHLQNFFPGLPESVWLPQLEGILGEDFAAERTAARGNVLTGERVVARGLVSRAELNDVQGTVERFDPRRGRCVVRFDGHTASILVKPSNLELVSEPDVLR